MNNQSIIKWRFLWAYIWIIGILYLVIYIGEDQLFGTHYSAWIFGLFQLLFGFYYYLKTRVWQYLLVGIVLGTGYWHYEAAAHMDTPFSMLTVYIHLVTLLLVFISAGPAITKSVRLEFHARKLFRLAAETVSGHEDGFTPRPYSAGDAGISHNDAVGLGRFLGGRDIVVYHVLDNKVIFSFSMNISPMVDADCTRTSIVVFEPSGRMTVRISQKDYNQYRKKLSFDQLCESFAKLFRHFIKAYLDNNETRIIHELKSA